MHGTTSETVGCPHSHLCMMTNTLCLSISTSSLLIQHFPTCVMTDTSSARPPPPSLLLWSMSIQISGAKPAGQAMLAHKSSTCDHLLHLTWEVATTAVRGGPPPPLVTPPAAYPSRTQLQSLQDMYQCPATAGGNLQQNDLPSFHTVCLQWVVHAPQHYRA